MIVITFEGGNGSTKPEVFYNADDKLFQKILPTITNFTSTINASTFQAFTLKSESLTISQIEYELNGAKSTIPYSSSCNFGISSISNKSVTLKITYINEHGVKSLSNTYQFTVNYDPVYTGKGITKVGNPTISKGILSNITSSNYLNTSMSINSLNNYNSLTFNIRFKTTVSPPEFRNLLGYKASTTGAGFRIGIWNNGTTIDFCPQTSPTLRLHGMQDFTMNKWGIIRLIYNLKTKKGTVTYLDDNKQTLLSKNFTLDSTGYYPSNKIQIGFGMNGYPSTGTQIDLNNTWIKNNANNEIISTWNL